MFRHKKIPQPFFCVLAILILLLLGNIFGVFRPMRNFAERVLIIPIKQKVYDWQRGLKKNTGECQPTAESKTGELKAKIASLTEENLALRRLLGAPLPKNWQFLPVKVIGVDKESFTLSAGKTDGVKEGMTGVFGETYLGKVVEASERVSVLRLPSFFEEKLVVKIVSGEKDNISGKGLLIGRGQGRMKIEQILSTEGVEKGDFVVTDVDGGDLLVGQVEEVEEAKGEVFKTAQIKRLYLPEELETVFLVRGKI